MTYLLPFFISVASTFFFTPFLITYLVKHNFVDVPDERKIHQGSIPRLGGLIIFANLTLNTLLFVKDLSSLRPIFLGALIILICGILDDLRGLSWKIKIGLQSLSALSIIFYFDNAIAQYSLFGFTIMEPFSYILIFFFILGTINSLNFLDGLDGLAGGFSLLFFSSIAIIAVVYSNNVLFILAIIMIGSLLGFLKFNAFPAKIFLGDTGSLILGYFIVFAALKVTKSLNHSIDLTIPLMLLSLPIIDTLKVMGVRIYRGRSPFHPDRNHLHHILLKLDIRHKIVVFFIIAIGMVFTGIALFYIFYSRQNATIMFIAAAIALLFGQYYLKTSSVEDIKYILSHIIKVPKFIYTNFQRYFLPVSVVIVMNYLLLSIPVKTGLDNSVIIMLLVTEAILLLIGSLNRKKTTIFNDVYILINFIIFFSFSNMSSTYSELIYKALVVDIFTGYTLIGISMLIIFFVITREQYSAKRLSYLSGMDLIISIIVATTYIMSLVMKNDLVHTISLTLTSAFIVYLWYKLIVLFNENYKVPIYYLSFGLSAISLLILLIN